MIFLSFAIISLTSIYAHMFLLPFRVALWTVRCPPKAGFAAGIYNIMTWKTKTQITHCTNKWSFFLCLPTSNNEKINRHRFLFKYIFTFFCVLFEKDFIPQGQRPLTNLTIRLITWARFHHGPTPYSSVSFLISPSKPHPS